MLSFHSKMVRLKVDTDNPRKIRDAEFPFQNGSIKRQAKHRDVSTRQTLFPFQTGSIKRFRCSQPNQQTPSFPFQTGSIKSYSFRNRFLRTHCFHSKLVRLKVNTRLKAIADGKREFPFQTGSIKSEQRTETPQPKTLFPFQTGSIKRSVRREDNCRATRVSIPNWFD